MRRAAAALLACAAAAGGAAAPDYVVHHAAQRTSAIAPAAARELGLSRSRQAGFVLLNVRRLDGTAVPAAAQGTARSLTGHVQELRFRTVQQAGVPDAIAEFQVLDGEWLTFELAVTPDGAAEAIPVKFQQQFYAE